MRVRFFDPGASYLKIKDEIDAAMQDVLARGDLILRKDIEEFEEKFAEYVGTKHAVALNSGTDALFLSLLAYGIGPKDTVLCPSYTFRATVDAALRTGAQVRLYDKGDVPTFSEVTCWIPAHIAGEVEYWIEPAIKLCRDWDILVIEDAAQAIGAAPVRGHTACYSFYPAKILGAYGDAGAVALNDPDKADWLRRARNHFKGENGPVGLNSRMDNIQAAVLNVKMKYLGEYIKRRKEIARMYDAGLLKVVLPSPREVYQDYIIEHPDVPGLMQHLADHGIETMANGYPFAEGVKKGMKTIAYEANSLRIPCNPDLTDEQVKFVIKKINDYEPKVA